MTRNEYIAQAAIAVNAAVFPGYSATRHDDGEATRWASTAADAVEFAIDLANELESQGVAPWQTDAKTGGAK